MQFLPLGCPGGLGNLLEQPGLLQALRCPGESKGGVPTPSTAPSLLLEEPFPALPPNWANAGSAQESSSSGLTGLASPLLGYPTVGSAPGFAKWLHVPPAPLCSFLSPGQGVVGQPQSGCFQAAWALVVPGLLIL